MSAAMHYRVVSTESLSPYEGVEFPFIEVKVQIDPWPGRLFGARIYSPRRIFWAGSFFDLNWRILEY